MKKGIIMVLMSTVFVASYGQSSDKTKKGSNTHAAREKRRTEVKGKCPVGYISLSTGFNNSVGLLGLVGDIPVSKAVSVEAGLGLSSWGTKLTLGGKYYLRPCHRGWAFGAGVTHNTGLANFHNKMETNNSSSDDVWLNLNPVSNLYFAAYHYVNLGARNNRFYTMIGYSMSLTANPWDQIDGYPISANSRYTPRERRPGGRRGPVMADADGASARCGGPRGGLRDPVENRRHRRAETRRLETRDSDA